MLAMTEPYSSGGLSPLKRWLDETAHFEGRDMSTGGPFAFAPKSLATHPHSYRNVIACTNYVVIALTCNAYAGQRCTPEKADWLVSHCAASELNVCSIIARAFAIVNSDLDKSGQNERTATRGCSPCTLGLWR